MNYNYCLYCLTHAEDDLCGELSDEEYDLVSEAILCLENCVVKELDLTLEEELVVDGALGLIGMYGY